MRQHNHRSGDDNRNGFHLTIVFSQRTLGLDTNFPSGKETVEEFLADIRNHWRLYQPASNTRCRRKQSKNQRTEYSLHASEHSGRGNIIILDLNRTRICSINRKFTPSSDRDESTDLLMESLVRSQGRRSSVGARKTVT